MSLVSAINRLIVIQAALSISDPVAYSVKKAFPYFPAQSKALADLPAFINTWTRTELNETASFRTSKYLITTQFAVGKVGVEDDQMALVATAFFEKYTIELGHDVALAGQATLINETAEDALRRWELGGYAYMGFEHHLEIQINEAFVYS